MWERGGGCERFGETLVNGPTIWVRALIAVVNGFGSDRVHFEIIVDVRVRLD